MFGNLLLDNLTIGVLVLNQKFKVKYQNEYMKKILKKHFNEGDFKYFEMNEALVRKFEKIDLEIKKCEIEKNGEKFIQLEFHNIRNLKEIEKDLEEKSKSQDKLVAMLDTVQEFIFYLDSEGRLEYFNKAYAQYLGKHPEELYGRKEIEFFPESMAKKCLENNKIAFERGNFYEEECFEGRWYQTFKSRVDLDNDDHGILAMVKEITESKKKSLDLKEKVYKDLLTNAYNRNFYEEKIRESLDKNKDKTFSMMVIDIDKFKHINDTKGHDIGDLVLKKLSKILKKSVRRKDDYIVRMGGDEFCVLIESNLEELEKVWERIQNEIALKEKEIDFTVSIGMGQRKEGEDLDSLYKRVDVELYKNKKEK